MNTLQKFALVAATSAALGVTAFGVAPAAAQTWNDNGYNNTWDNNHYGAGGQYPSWGVQNGPRTDVLGWNDNGYNRSGWNNGYNNSWDNNHYGAGGQYPSWGVQNGPRTDVLGYNQTGYNGYDTGIRDMVVCPSGYHAGNADGLCWPN